MNQGLKMTRDEMVDLWEQHAGYEFVVKDADKTVSTMVDDASVMHLPTMSGGFGKEVLRRYYREEFIPGIPADTTQEMVARSVGDTFLLEESIMRLTHDQVVPFLLPGLEPTGKIIEIDFLVMVQFRDGLMQSERLYWDQATVLNQIGLIDSGLPFAPVSEVSKFLRERVVNA